jgi:hypothetical protein
MVAPMPGSPSNNLLAILTLTPPAVLVDELDARGFKRVANDLQRRPPPAATLTVWRNCHGAPLSCVGITGVDLPVRDVAVAVFNAQRCAINRTRPPSNDGAAATRGRLA